MIDEYDVPLDKAYQRGYYEQMIDLIRARFSKALKTNDSLFRKVFEGHLKRATPSEKRKTIAAAIPILGTVKSYAQNQQRHL